MYSLVVKVLAVVFIFCMSTLLRAEGYKIDEVEFDSHGAKLAGSILFPDNDEVHAAIVFVHGSGKQSRNMHVAARFASEGIAALVYDKRGVGRSGGKYEGKQSVSEKNINLLADDAIAALNVLHNHPKTKSVPKGLTGISQAGWIVPLAAEKSGTADFMVLWSGPVTKVSEEDIYSKYTSDQDDKRVPSYQEALDARKVKYVWPDFLGKDSNPSDSLAKLEIPGLWVFGQNDGSIPVDLSIVRLRQQIDMGRDYEYVLFPSLGHNNMKETFPTVLDWIAGKTRNSD